MYQNQKRKKFEIFTKIFDLCQASRFKYSETVYIKSIIGSISFFSSSSTKSSTFYWDVMLLPLILHLSLFKFFVFFKFNMLSQKSDKNNSIRIIFIKIIIKINIIKINMNNTHFILIKYKITRIFIKIEYIFICILISKKFLNHFTCNRPIRNKFQCC